MCDLHLAFVPGTGQAKESQSLDSYPSSLILGSLLFLSALHEVIGQFSRGPRKWMW